MARRTLGQTVARQALEIEGHKKDLAKQREEIGKLRAAFEVADEARTNLRQELQVAKDMAAERQAQIDILLTVVRMLR